MLVMEPGKQFMKDSLRLVKRCTKPDRKEYQKIAMATAIGFAIMGFIGFFVKLIHIPINNIIVGAMDQIISMMEPGKQFMKDSLRLVKSCTKPDRKEYQKIAMATTIGFAIMGFISLFVGIQQLRAKIMDYYRLLEMEVLGRGALVLRSAWWRPAGGTARRPRPSWVRPTVPASPPLTSTASAPSTTFSRASSRLMASPSAPYRRPSSAATSPPTR